MIVFTWIAQVARWWWFKAGWQIKAITIGLLIGFAIVIHWSYQNWQINRLENELNQEKINRRMDEVNGLTNQITNSLEQGNVLKQNSNNADIKRGNISNRDSNQFSGSDAFKRFCARFPNDSRCRK